MVPDGIVDSARRQLIVTEFATVCDKSRCPCGTPTASLALCTESRYLGRVDSVMLDRYILAKLAVLRDDLSESMEVYDIPGACEHLRQFTEALINWWRATVAFAVLGRRRRCHRHATHRVEVTTRLAAPLLPPITGDGVHASDRCT